MTGISLTLLALVAFASNSILCRLALGGGFIDAASFTTIRLLSGIAVLVLLASLQNTKKEDAPPQRGSWRAGAMLFAYAIAFSYAYLSLDAGTGALILFGAVQITMIAATLMTGHKLHATEWTGVIVAFAGLVYLNLPSASAPSLPGFVLMSIAGISWGIYTLLGRGSTAPLLDTQANFLRTLPFSLVLVPLIAWRGELSQPGVLLAVASGALASGVGYAIWYSALKSITSTQAAVVQLSVPVLAAAGGVAFLAEPVTLRLTVSALMTLGGILLVLVGRRLAATI